MMNTKNMVRDCDVRNGCRKPKKKEKASRV